MPICPFSHDYRECYPTCALYAEAIGKCSFYVQAMLLEDLQKVAVVSYEKLIRNEESFLLQRMAELEKLEKEQESKPEPQSRPNLQSYPTNRLPGTVPRHE